ncbi:MAG: type II toxin-antitoxin system VapC family toxin [Staphylothermus sp.]|nr:type II toxin-antitoxin system VapC family toxin [Staphylothermus sp.]
MKKKYVLDAGILALYFAGNKSVKKYIDNVYDGQIDVYMLEINLAEFLYNYARIFGWNAALVKHSLVRNSPIKIIGLNEELTTEAAKLKIKYYNTLSLADCYLIAFAKKYKAKIITTDHVVKNVNEAPTILIPI